MTEQHKSDSSPALAEPPRVATSSEGEIPEDPRIVEVVQDYLAQLEKGEIPNRAAYVQRYPELAQAIEQCLEGLDLVHTGLHETRTSTRVEAAGPAQSAQSDFLPDALGDFRIVRELARGGMGVVYEAVQLSLGRRVALKVLPFAATLDSRHLQRFKSEAQAAALLHHPNIVPVYAVGCERGVHFYAMQLIEGQSLAALIVQLRRQAGLPTPEDYPASSAIHSSHVLGSGRMTGSSVASRGGRTPPTDAPRVPDTVSQFHAELSTQHAGRDARYFQTAARLMLDAALALEHAHEFGIVHRDIKPANLLLEVHGNLWVTDFGLAQFQTETGLTRTGDIPGTIRYMSPEQASGQRTLDQRTDVYSLGATFYELLTLEPIFRGRDLQYLLNQVLHTDPRGLRQIDKSIPAELDTIILKSVSKNPADRYRSAGDLAADLRRFLDHKPIQARPPTVIDRVRKWSRRHPSAVIAGMLLLVVVAVGLFISNQREKERANEAELHLKQARQAVDVLIEVSENDLADNPHMQGTRQRLLGIALEYYQDFINQRKGDVAGQAELDKVRKRVEGILNEMKLLQRDMQRWALENPAVPEALQLADAQREKLAELREKWKDEPESIKKDWRELSEDARWRRAVLRAEEHNDALELLLTPEQRQRLSEIVIQNAGIFAFRDPEIVTALELTLEQRKAIREIERGLFRHRFDQRGEGRVREGAAGGPPRMTKREAVSKVLELLTPNQIRKWNELIGPPFAGIDDPPPRGLQGFGPPNERRGSRENDGEKRPPRDETPPEAAERPPAA
jgi:serine/threonine protein kinase